MRLKRVAKTAGIMILALVILALLLHLIITWRTKEIFNFIVKQVSHEKYRSHVKSVSFSYYPLMVSAVGASLEPVDSSAEKNCYKVSVDSLDIGIAGLWQLVVQKDIDLTNLNIIHPEIVVINNDTATGKKKLFNVPLNEIQNALMRSLTALKVDRCRIADAGIVYDQNRHDKQPLMINHIFIDIDSLGIRPLPGNSTNGENFYAAIKLFLDHPDVQLPDTSLKVEIRDLLVDTRKNQFSVNQFKMAGRYNGGSVDSISLSKIRVRNFNWPRWLQEGIIEIDSLKASNGSTFFDFSDRKLFDLKSNNKTRVKKQIVVPFVIHAVEINKIQYSLRTLSKKGPFTVQLDGDSFGVREIALTKDTIRPLRVGDLSFKVVNFSTSDDDNSTISAFDKLIISNNDLVLQNYHRSLDNERLGGNSSISIPSLRVVNFSLDDLLQYKLVAEKLVLEKPSLIIDIHKAGKKQDADSSIAKITGSLKPSLDIKQLSIKDASITLIPHASPTENIRIEDLNTEIDAQQLLNAHSVMEMIWSATALSSSAFHVKGSNVNLEVRRSSLTKEQDGVYIQQVRGSIGQNIVLDLYGVNLLDKKGNFNVAKLQSIELDNVSVDSGRVVIQKAKKVKPRGNVPELSIHDVSAGKLLFEWQGEDGKNLLVKNIKMNGHNVVMNNGEVSWGSINGKTGSALWKTKNIDIYASSINIQQPGVLQLRDVDLQPNQPSAISKAKIPLLTVSTSLMSSSAKSIVAEKIEIDKPVLHLDLSAAADQKNSPLQLPEFYAKELVITDPQITLDQKDSLREAKFTSNAGVIKIVNLNSGKTQEKITIAALQLNLAKPVIALDSTIYAPERLSVKASKIAYDANAKELTAFLDTAEVTKMMLHVDEETPIEVEDASAGIRSFAFSSKDSFDLKTFAKNTRWWAKAGAIRQRAKQHWITVYNPEIDNGSSVVSFDSLSMIPTISRDSFWRSYPFEKDYMTLRLGPTRLYDWKTSGWGKDISISATRMVTSNTIFYTEKDKTRGPDPVTYRPLLARSLRKIPFSFSIDTVEINNGFLRHNIIPERTGREGNIFFTDINGRMINVKNYGYYDNDSLRLRIHAALYGQGDLQVSFRQSYVDTIQGFWLRAGMGNLEMSALNPLLTPLASVKIDRGHANSMLMVVEGNDYVAFGSMELQYKNLRVSLLKKGENEYFLSRSINGLLNLFIRSQDNQRKNLIFQERMRDKAIFNFWGKIALNGLLANLGIKRDKQQLRKYQKEIKGKKLPDYSGDL